MSNRPEGLDLRAFGTGMLNRRAWLKRHVVGLLALTPSVPPIAGWGLLPRPSTPGQASHSADRAARGARQAVRLDPAPWQALAQRAVEAAQAAGAQYADARLTRLVRHDYAVQDVGLSADVELVGVGVRVLGGGYWGFSASAVIAPDEVVRLARDAVALATENAKGAPWAVELGPPVVATGSWATPVRIDPFTVSIEEKSDFISYWKQCANQMGLEFSQNGRTSWLSFVRQERVLATSEGVLVTQTLYESGGRFIMVSGGGLAGALGLDGGGATQDVHDLTMAGAGWERFLDADIPEQFFSGRILHELAAQAAIPHKPSTIGKYALVCDGATMAALVEQTLGLATQLDRALGYEANAGGTSWIDDPLALVGRAQVTAPLLTLTADRSMPQALATVKWDDEGVEPEPFTLIQDGVLVDFQTMREQAAWLAPYYQQHGLPVRSHGCAAAESAHVIPLQRQPNLTLAASAKATTVGVADLVADVTDGILVERGAVYEVDSQARTGLLLGAMREIKNGRLGKALDGGAVLFDSAQFWKSVAAVGGPATRGELGWSPNGNINQVIGDNDGRFLQLRKGEPPQSTSHTVWAVAAMIPNQPVIDPTRKA